MTLPKFKKVERFNHFKGLPCGEKSSWGPGPWVLEPDKCEWRDERVKLPCLVVRNDLGCWCGYSAVSEGHPAFGKTYDEIDAQIEVHGGLTFSDQCHEGGRICHVAEPGEPDHVWWLGFDTGHCDDYWPAYQATMTNLGRPSQEYRAWRAQLRRREPGQTMCPKGYWTLEMIVAETEKLALQLYNMESTHCLKCARLPGIDVLLCSKCHRLTCAGCAQTDSPVTWTCDRCRSTT